MATKTSKSTPFPVVVSTLSSGLQKVTAPSGKPVPVQGTFYTFPQLVTKLAGIIALQSAVKPAKDAYTHAVAAVRAEAPSDRAFVKALKAALIQVFGADVQSLATLGITVTTRSKPSAATTAAAVAKRAAKAKQKEDLQAALAAGTFPESASSTSVGSASAASPTVNEAGAVVATAAAATK